MIFTDPDKVVVSRRYFLFQIAEQSEKQTQKPIPALGRDISDYDDPSSPVYWRNVPNFSFPGPDYQNALKTELKGRLDALLAGISNKTIVLKRSQGKPYTELSDFVKTFDDYSVKLEELDNQITLRLARPESTDSEPAKTDEFGNFVPKSPDVINTVFSSDVFGALQPQENDVLMIRTSYQTSDQDKKRYEVEFLGLVTKVIPSFRYGNIDSFTLEVYGLSKMYHTSQVISQKSLNPSEFIVGVELNDPSAPVPFANAFNDKDVKGIFDVLVSNSLSATLDEDVTKPITADPAKTGFYRLDPAPFISFEKTGFQYNLQVLLTLFLMATTDAPVDDELWPKSVDPSQLSAIKNIATDVSDLSDSENTGSQQPLLDQPFLGLLERGQQKAFNLMLANGWEFFHSQMKRPNEIFQEARSSSYTDIFESRNGITICRPPRYNKVESTFSEFKRVSAKSSAPFGSSKTVSGGQLLFLDKGIWKFSSESDFVIDSSEIISIDPSKNDMALESRIDEKIQLPLVGDTQFPAGMYVDPDLVAKYGLRTHGPVTNPNCLKPVLAKIFGPIALTMINAPTRTIVVRVSDFRKFFVGKLYYIAPINAVAYLTQDMPRQIYGQKNVRELSFSMARNVITRNIQDILKDKNEILNVGLMFTDDWPAEVPDRIDFPFLSFADNGASEGETLKDFVYSSGRDFLNILASNGGTALQMFRYIPSIEDLILELEDNPDLAEKPHNAEALANADNPAANKENMLRSFLDDSSEIYFTFGFKNQNFGYQPNIEPQLEAIFEAAKAASPTNILGGDPTTVDFHKLPNCPLPAAGILGYVMPSENQTAINLDSGFDEVQTLPVLTSQAILNPGTQSLRLVRNPIQAGRTPFNAASLSDPPQYLALSQLLTNLLAENDLATKTLFNSAGAPLQLDLNLQGIPQIYFFDGQDFQLFGSKKTPEEYYLDIAETRSGLAINFIATPAQKLNQAVLASPGILKFDGEKFDNPFFSIPPSADGNFDLPWGHLVIPGSDLSQPMGFFLLADATRKTTGARFSVTTEKTNVFDILGIGPNSKIFSTKTGTAEILPGGLPMISASNGIYFISPFLEPTLERLLDIALPPSLGGNLSVSQAQQQKSLAQQTNSPTLSDEMERQNGRAINVSPAYLFLSSGGNIQVKSAFNDFFEKLIGAGNFHTLFLHGDGFTASSANPNLTSDLIGERRVTQISVDSGLESIYSKNLNKHPGAA